MTPAQLAALLASRRKDGEHGAHNCPKCGEGFMAYQKIGSGSFHACTKCSWIEFGSPPWPKRKKTEAA
jgi:ribosomal protein S27AE